MLHGLIRTPVTWYRERSGVCWERDPQSQLLGGMEGLGSTFIPMQYSKGLMDWSSLPSTLLGT